MTMTQPAHLLQQPGVKTSPDAASPGPKKPPEQGARAGDAMASARGVSLPILPIGIRLPLSQVPMAMLAPVQITPPPPPPGPTTNLQPEAGGNPTEEEAEATSPGVAHPNEEAHPNEAAPLNVEGQPNVVGQLNKEDVVGTGEHPRIKT